MTELKPGIHELLEQLRKELSEVQSPQTKENLSALVESIETRINTRLDEDHQRDLVSELTEELVEFEIEHPGTAGTIRGLINMLSNLGL